MYVVVELWGGESLGVKSNRVDFGVVQRYNRENGSEGVVRGISFEDDLCVWNPMSQNQSSGEGFFEHFKEFPAFQGEIPNNSFPSQMREQNHNIEVVKYESLVKVCKSEKGLNVLDFAWFRPFLDGLDLVIGHSETSQR